MSARHLGIAKGIFEGRTFGFIISIDDAKNRLFFPLPANNDFKNGELVSYEFTFDWQGRRYAREVKRATPEDTCDKRITGWVRDFDEGRNIGHLHDGGGNFYKFHAEDLWCDALFEESEVTFVPQVSERGVRFALAITTAARRPPIPGRSNY